MWRIGSWLVVVDVVVDSLMSDLLLQLQTPNPNAILNPKLNLNPKRKQSTCKSCVGTTGEHSGNRTTISNGSNKHRKSQQRNDSFASVFDVRQYLDLFYGINYGFIVRRSQSSQNNPWQMFDFYFGYVFEYLIILIAQIIRLMSLCFYFAFYSPRKRWKLIFHHHHHILASLLHLSNLPCP